MIFEIIENYNSADEEAHKVGKIVRFWPKFDFHFLNARTTDNVKR